MQVKEASRVTPFFFSSSSKETTGRRGRRGRKPRKYSSRKLIHTGVFASQGVELKLLQQITKYVLLISLEANDNTTPTSEGCDVLSLLPLSVFLSCFVASQSRPRRRTSSLFLQTAASGDVTQPSSPDSHNTAKRRGPFQVQL